MGDLNAIQMSISLDRSYDFSRKALRNSERTNFERLDSVL